MIRMILALAVVLSVLVVFSMWRDGELPALRHDGPRVIDLREFADFDTSPRGDTESVVDAELVSRSVQTTDLAKQALVEVDVASNPQAEAVDVELETLTPALEDEPIAATSDPNIDLVERLLKLYEQLEETR